MPYGKKLTDTEVVARMVELRNLRSLHAHDRKQIAALKLRVKTLEQEKADDRAYFETLIQKQAVQIAELQTMVFGKKKRPPTGKAVPVLPLPVPTPRTKGSYRRPLPPASAITAEVAVPLPAACSCGGSFDSTKTTIHERYAEDIPLPGLTPDYQSHLVTKYVIERGSCLACGKAATGGSRDLGGQTVTLGPNVRLFVTHLVGLVGMSYAQVTNLLLSLYDLTISDGEVAGILQEKHAAWLPAYSQLKADIRAAPVRHYDETPWAIQAEQGAGYAWVMAAHGSPNTLFHCATSRGAPHATRLHGNGSAAVHISDDYQAYRTLPGSQQLCWVHLYRVIRDLRHNANLPEEQLPYVTQWYETFAAIYQDLRQYLGEPYDEVVRATQANELWRRTKDLAQQPAPPADEPDKLRRLKAQLLRASKDRLFVCLPKNTPCDNNRAERDLRQLVLKRKRSFGSKTERGAQALATVLSLCTTAWRTTPQDYFRALAALG
jgi:transposase